MKKVLKGRLTLKDMGAGPEVVAAFPDRHTPPWTVYVRQTYIDHRKDIDRGVEATWPGIGVVTFRGRKFRFDFDENYAKVKGYEPTREGTWG